MNIKLNTKYLVDTNLSQLKNLYEKKVETVFGYLKNKSGLGSEMLGWINWVQQDHEVIIQKMETLKQQWKEMGVNTVVVVGIGGSYIGVRAGVEYTTDVLNSNDMQIMYVSNFSALSLSSLLKKLANKKFGVVVISKSGTTLETAVGFRMLREMLHKNYPNDLNKLIVAVTDKSKGVLRKIVDQHNYLNFSLEDDIGGRFSSITPVGLLPALLAGSDVRKMLSGAKKAFNDCFNGDIKNNTAAQYAALRHYMYTKLNKKIECLCSYDPQLNFLIEQTKQLFGESEGKDNKALMPILLNFTTDLHSVGQLLQQGDKCFFETVFLVQNAKADTKIPKSSFNDDDQLDWLADKSLSFINEKAFLGTVNAHSVDGHVNNLVVEIQDWSVESFGYSYFWLCLTTAFSAYLLEVNPFDQPGVEAYKKRMFSLLGKK